MLKVDIVETPLNVGIVLKAQGGVSYRKPSDIVEDLLSSVDGESLLQAGSVTVFKLDQSDTIYAISDEDYMSLLRGAEVVLPMFTIEDYNQMVKYMSINAEVDIDLVM